MGNVAIVYRVMPEGLEVNLDRLEEEIRKIEGVKDVRKEPVAFGLSSLKVLAIIPDEEGAGERIERMLSSLPGVSSVEVIGLTLVG